MRPEPMANEVLLLHNITESNAAQILRHGFDERLARTNLYGRGIYFTVVLVLVSCSAWHYCHHVALILLRQAVPGVWTMKEPKDAGKLPKASGPDGQRRPRCLPLLRHLPIHCHDVGLNHCAAQQEGPTS